MTTETPPDSPRPFPAEPTEGRPEVPTLTDVLDALDDVTKLLDGVADTLVERRPTVPADRRDDYAEVEDQVASAWARATLALTSLRPISTNLETP